MEQSFFVEGWTENVINGMEVPGKNTVLSIKRELIPLLFLQAQLHLYLAVNGDQVDSLMNIFQKILQLGKCEIP